MIPYPDLRYERRLWKAGIELVVGLDEAGRGALAGPVAVGAVILPADLRGLRKKLQGLHDSKLMTPNERERVRGVIQSCAVAYTVGFSRAEEIDALGINGAVRRAAWNALMCLGPSPQFLLSDFRLELPETTLPEAWLVKGDQLSLSIAAASVLAKTARDAQMCKMDAKYPGYGFAVHKGYGTAQHREAIGALGYSPLHRRSFQVRSLA
jgi:ribonuclease HII